MEDSIFTKIINRQIPAQIVYEDDDTIAILDIAPNNPGHTLVIPKSPVRNVLDTDEETWVSVMKVVRKIAPAIKEATGADGLNINSNHEPGGGQVVPHLHVHIIPRYENDGLKFFPGKRYEEDEEKIMGDKIRTAIAS